MDFVAQAAGVCTALGPEVPPNKVKANLPLVIAALTQQGILTDACAIGAIATIGVETPTFSPVKERGGPAYLGDLYDKRTDLGNLGPPDGANFRGRGFVQITGRYNYLNFGRAIGKDLIANPDLALDPAIAAMILAVYFRQRGIPAFALANNWEMVRRRVNGGLTGYARFISIVEGLQRLGRLVEQQAASAAAAAAPVAPQPVPTPEVAPK